MKAPLLKAIDKKIESLDTHIDKTYWNEFRDFVESFKPEKKSVEERQKEFYNEIAQFKEKYPKAMLREFYEYWTEKSKNGLKMRFEKQTTWDLSKRLARWSRSNKGKYNQESTKEIGTFTK